MPDNGIAVEPREAQRPTSMAARTPQAATPGNGDIAVGARWTGDSGPPKGGVAHRPGASRRSIPSYRGETENRADAPASQTTGAAERWLNGRLETESMACRQVLQHPSPDGEG